MLLAYIGRGDFGVDHLLTAFRAIRETFPSKDLAIAQLTAEQTLAEYLTDAMEEAQKRRIDLDELRFEDTVTVS